MRRSLLWGLLAAGFMLVVVAQFGHAGSRLNSGAENQYTPPSQSQTGQFNPNRPFDTARSTTSTQRSNGQWMAQNARSQQNQGQRFAANNARNTANRGHHRMNQNVNARSSNGRQPAVSVKKLTAFQWTPARSSRGNNPGGVFFSSYVNNRTNMTQPVHHIWYKGNQKIKEATLFVPPSSGRVMSSVPLQASGNGQFRVEVRDRMNNVMKTMQFSVGRG